MRKTSMEAKNLSVLYQHSSVREPLCTWNVVAYRKRDGTHVYEVSLCQCERAAR